MANFEISNKQYLAHLILLLNEEASTESLKYDNLSHKTKHYVHNLQILPFYFILIWSFRENSRLYMCPIPTQNFTTYPIHHTKRKQKKRECFLVKQINILQKWNKKENKTNLYKQYSLRGLVGKKQALFFDLRKV